MRRRPRTFRSPSTKCRSPTGSGSLKARRPFAARRSLAATTPSLCKPQWWPDSNWIKGENTNASSRRKTSAADHRREPESEPGLESENRSRRRAVERIANDLPNPRQRVGVERRKGRAYFHRED